ncbi:hypothetical protein EDC18_1107 [Natranaerovirga pectinivora]|uniref:Uncharacterized protein n=1 Tax=Natranaerovirga pectinivora TaxID=682400 RepID=A0A4R3MGM4_9FIRM|nr:hypothetical protein [Natranaerovirga pectinivora]TCT12933.1 hypothetical protein EDC18_1107 [Natranaerovirga pectinivora]
MIEETNLYEKEKLKINDVLKTLYEEKEYMLGDQLALDLLSKYCNIYYKGQVLSEIDEELFNKFILYYLPKSKLNISEDRVKKVLVNIYKILEGIKIKYNYDLTNIYRLSYLNYGDDIARIIDLRKQLLRNTECPVISWDPLIIDFSYYKQHNSKKKWLPRKEVYEQGYYEMVDKVGYDSYLFKKVQGSNTCVKIRLEKGTAKLLKHNDVLHMRLKRKIFTTCWEIIEIKGCYLSESNKYINLKV